MRAPFGVVIITGASSGLGAALARAYARPGIVLGLLGRDRQRLEGTAGACRAKGATVYDAAIDVSEASGMASWVCHFDRQHAILKEHFHIIFLRYGAEATVQTIKSSITVGSKFSFA